MSSEEIVISFDNDANITSFQKAVIKKIYKTSQSTRNRAPCETGQRPPHELGRGRLGHLCHWYRRDSGKSN